MAGQERRLVLEVRVVLAEAQDMALILRKFLLRVALMVLQEARQAARPEVPVKGLQHGNLEKHLANFTLAAAEAVVCLHPVQAVPAV